jgi:SAM-dependent methyltransferase
MAHWAAEVIASMQAEKGDTSLRERYELEWGTEFWEFVDRALRPGAAILDIGAGRRPTIQPDQRPAGSHYVGLDVSGHELEMSDEGSYDETIVTDAQVPVLALIDRFDLIVAWQVLEHFSDVRQAVNAFHGYLKEGGWFVACLSGRHAAFAVANRALPARFGRGLVTRLMRRPTDTVFPAYYDHCDEHGLRTAFAGWDEVHIVPLWHGADYFARLPHLRSLYLRYEDWVIARGFTNLATHYVVAASKGGSRSVKEPK